MGYTGYAVLARSEKRLDELPCIDDLLVTVSDNEFADGWRLGFLGPCDDVSSESLVAELVEQTNAPAIAIFVVDSDFGFGACASPVGAAAGFYLDEETCLGEVGDMDEVEPLNGDALPVLMAWAAEAGFAPNADVLAAAMEVRPGPFGDGVVEFVEALGARPLPE